MSDNDANTNPLQGAAHLLDHALDVVLKEPDGIHPQHRDNVEFCHNIMKGCLSKLPPIDVVDTPPDPMLLRPEPLPMKEGRELDVPGIHCRVCGISMDKHTGNCGGSVTSER